MCVVDRIVDRLIPIQCYGTQVQDRGRAAQDVKRQPGLTRVQTKVPLPPDTIDHIERHDEHGDGDVRHRQRDQVHVLTLFQGSIREHGQDDQSIANDSEQHDDEGGQGDGECLDNRNGEPGSGIDDK